MTMAFTLLLGLSSFNNNNNILLVSGAEFYAPETLSSGDTGKLDVTLTVDVATTMDGKRTSAVYNNSPMGPTLRVKPGDTLTVTLVNNLPKATSVDRELYDYVYDEQHEMNDFVNTTIIYNRLDEIGNLFNPKFGYWGTNYVNLHFHGTYVMGNDNTLYILAVTLLLSLSTTYLHCCLLVFFSYIALIPLYIHFPSFHI